MNTQNRYQLAINHNLVDQADTLPGSFVKAFYHARRAVVPVRVLDNMADQGDVVLWEFRPFEEFPRVIRVKY